MRLFKFLIISDSLISSLIIDHTIKKEYIVRVRKNGNNRTRIDDVEVKNTLYKFTCNPKIGLMKIDYRNEIEEFNLNNSAYIVIDSERYSDIMSGISPLEKNSSLHGFYKIEIRYRDYCDKLACVNKSICKSSKQLEKISEQGIKTARGTTWTFNKDTRGTRYKGIEPRTGGIAYSCLQWKEGSRPKIIYRGRKKKRDTIAIPLQHWIRCHSIPVNVEKDRINAKKVNSYYSIGHTFDCRYEFIGLATGEEQKKNEKKELKSRIYRGKKVLARQLFFSENILNCNCNEKNIRLQCRQCAGVLYINKKEKLVDLYNQLISSEYEELKTIHNMKVKR